MKIPSARPDIGGILNTPVINKRIKNFLTDEQFEQEFSHKILDKIEIL